MLFPHHHRGKHFNALFFLVVSPRGLVHIIGSSPLPLSSGGIFKPELGNTKYKYDDMLCYSAFCLLSIIKD